MSAKNSGRFFLQPLGTFVPYGASKDWPGAFSVRNKRAKSDRPPLRVASLIRVSTERQARRGESLNVQLASNARDVAIIGGTIVETYGGQEHGTPGWERKEVDRLIADASKGQFEAVILAYPDRWSRDNFKSEEGLNVFIQNGIRFFVGAQEYNLNDPTQKFTLALFVSVGQLQAGLQNKKSMESKLARAKRGIPVGNLPFGRTFNRETMEWGVDEKKQKAIQEIAERYLGGESMRRLSEEFDIPHAGRILRESSGTTWKQHLRYKALKLDEICECRVPPLLPEVTIKAIAKRAESQRTYTHGYGINKYLLGGFVRCIQCGSTLTGMCARGRRYYRHFTRLKKAGKCLALPMWIPAQALEASVWKVLFAVFGDPARVQQAIEAAAPNQSEKEARRRVKELEKLIDREDAGVRLLYKREQQGYIPKKVAEPEYVLIGKRRAVYQTELDQLTASLKGRPSPEVVAAAAQCISESFRRQQQARKTGVNRLDWADDLAEPAWADKRRLLEIVLADDKKLGIFVFKDENRWYYVVNGRFVKPDVYEEFEARLVGEEDNTSEGPYVQFRQQELMRSAMRPVSKE
jgi:site-specific DNA recombinase